ncbi:nuclear transport factor 2 family protein [Streptosporangium sp. NPDC051022]|uniref:nuclear transport factor 2 family protein n=1 Tax=Streptosporangium sp. NPDC051022 TaxID=3155752 RepID=UPI00343D55AB
MTRAAEPVRVFADGALHGEIQQFYAWQVRLLDHGEAEAWADTFTEDGVFEEVTKGEALRGRRAIAASARARADAVAAEGVRRRHWFGMLDVRPQSDGTLHATFYALVMATPKGGGLSVYVSAEARDVLVPFDGTWLVRHRAVHHDAG